MKGRIFIIAEAGVNHNGDLATAKRMVEVAVRAGADAVKFQTFKADRVASASAPKAGYQRRTTDAVESQLDMIRRLELAPAAHRTLLGHCRRTGILFLSTAFDLGSIDLLAALGVGTFKIPSGELTNLPYLRKIGALGKKIILSTGMADLGEIEAALAALTRAGTPKRRITLLHCTTEYPAPPAEVNLRAMLTLKAAFGTAVGYSDHTRGIAIPIAAAALGATVIEKHFTLDRTMEGPDHKASLEPPELSAMIRAVRTVERALGDGAKRPSPSELRNREAARKSIVASRAIKKGERFSARNITAKRPGTGISPMRWDEVVGLRARRGFAKDEPIAL